MSIGIPMIEQVRKPSIRIERLQEAVRAAFDILTNDVPLEDILARRDRAARREPVHGKAEVLLERLNLAANVLALDLEEIAKIRAGAPKNPPKGSPQELAALGYPAEITGSKSRYGGGFDTSRGDDISDLFPAA